MPNHAAVTSGAPPAPAGSFLSIRSLTKSFGPFQALKSIDLEIAEGEFVCFLGPSGCGKTTLLRAIAGLDRQTSGTISLRGKDVSNAPPSARDFGIVFQSYALFPNLSVADNVGYGLVNQKKPRAAIAARVAELLALVGLPDQAMKYPAQLSGGQQQRVALARALATSPGLLLLDEPLSALDARVRLRLREEIRALQRRLGVTTIMVTHDQEEALSMAERIVVMNHGVIEQVGTPEEVYARPKTAFVADFVGRMTFLAGVMESETLVRVGSHALRVTEASGITTGQKVELGLRPEAVRLVEGPGENRLAMCIAELEYLGSFVRATLIGEGASPLTLLADLPFNVMQDRAYAPGQAVIAELPPGALRVFPTPSERMSVDTAPVTPRHRDREAQVATALLAGLALLLVLLIAVPLWSLLSKSVQNANGQFVGLANFTRYISTPVLVASLWNSLWVSSLVALIVVPLAFLYAYALTRSRMPGRGLFMAVAMTPLFAPSLLSAISLIYIFGNQGFLKSWLFGASIYGPVGIVLAEAVYCFPHALMILVTALRLADGRLYEVADALGTSKPRVFFTVTLPGARYGLISAIFVVFTLVITDFGIPKVIGGQFNVLATDAYKQIVGQQNFEMGAVVGLILLLPAIFAFFVDRQVQKKQVALLSARAVPYEPKANARRDTALFAFCLLIGGLLIGMLGMAIWASFIRYWPYNLSLTLNNYNFSNFDPQGWGAYLTSLQMAGLTAIVGTAIVFAGAYLVEKTKPAPALRGFVHFLAMLPMAVPGLVLGLGYVFFVNAPWNPLGIFYGTLTVLVANTVAHFYTVAHITAVTQLKQIDAEFESVSASLKVPFWVTFRRVTVPISLPAVADIAVYLFVNALTTVSAVIFLYGPSTKLASIAIVHMDEMGAVAAAAAMATCIVFTAMAVKLLHLAMDRLVLARFQARRKR